MGKRSKEPAKYRKYNSSFQVLPVSFSSGFSGLADLTVITNPLFAINDDFWVQSADLTWSIGGHTEDQGSVNVGLALGDLSVTEIKEALEALPVSRSDIIARERARRPIRKVGTFPGLESDESLNDGRPIRTTVKMYLAEGVDLNAYVYNTSGGSLTAGTYRCLGNVYGQWK